MSPFEHGEVFVLDDGGEVDLDLGNYERFLDISLTRDNNITTGKIYSKVIEAERRGDYLGKTVQVIPHVTDAVQDWIEEVANYSTEDESRRCLYYRIRRNVGDIESAPYIEALRQFQFRVEGKYHLRSCITGSSYGSSWRTKDKPTQHTVKEMMGLVSHLMYWFADPNILLQKRQRIS